MTLAHINSLEGRHIVRWVALEMALSEHCSTQPGVRWYDQRVLYRQFVSVDMEMADGSVCRLLSREDESCGDHDLYLLERDAIELPALPENGSIYRTRELSELPTGMATFRPVERDSQDAIVRAELLIGGHVVLFWSAEVYERDDGCLDIVDRDESILVQLDGQHPLAHGSSAAWR